MEEVIESARENLNADDGNVVAEEIVLDVPIYKSRSSRGVKR